MFGTFRVRHLVHAVALVAAVGTPILLTTPAHAENPIHCFHSADGPGCVEPITVVGPSTGPRGIDPSFYLPRNIFAAAGEEAYGRVRELTFSDEEGEVFYAPPTPPTPAPLPEYQETNPSEQKPDPETCRQWVEGLRDECEDRSMIACGILPPSASGVCEKCPGGLGPSPPRWPATAGRTRVRPGSRCPGWPFATSSPGKGSPGSAPRGCRSVRRPRSRSGCSGRPPQHPHHRHTG
jgi:hypothetical protein